MDLVNAFSLVSRQTLLSECSTHFPELLPCVSWCYFQHPVLWHILGNLTSQSGVQQGDPLGPLLFSLVLNVVIKVIATHPECSDCAIMLGTLMTVFLQAQVHMLGKHSPYSLSLVPPLAFMWTSRSVRSLAVGVWLISQLRWNSQANTILRSWEYPLVMLTFVVLSWKGRGLRPVFYLRG